MGFRPHAKLNDKMISQENLTSFLKYRPIKIGSAEVREYPTGNFSLYVDNVEWMDYDVNDHFSAREQFFEINIAYGHVLVTGLGLGVRESILLSKPEVSKITIIEKNRDVIEIFNTLCIESNINLEKVEILNIDAEFLEDFQVDCIFLDHYEHEYIEEIEKSVRSISKKNQCSKLWFWKAWVSYFIWIIEKRENIDYQNFQLWCNNINIDNLERDVNEDMLFEIRKLYDYYIRNLGFTNEYQRTTTRKQIKSFLGRSRKVK